MVRGFFVFVVMCSISTKGEEPEARAFQRRGSLTGWERSILPAQILWSRYFTQKYFTHSYWMFKKRPMPNRLFLLVLVFLSFYQLQSQAQIDISSASRSYEVFKVDPYGKPACSFEERKSRGGSWSFWHVTSINVFDEKIYSTSWRKFREKEGKVLNVSKAFTQCANDCKEKNTFRHLILDENGLSFPRISDHEKTIGCILKSCKEPGEYKNRLYPVMKDGTVITTGEDLSKRRDQIDRNATTEAVYVCESKGMHVPTIEEYQALNSCFVSDSYEVDQITKESLAILHLKFRDLSNDNAWYWTSSTETHSVPKSRYLKGYYGNNGALVGRDSLTEYRSNNFVRCVNRWGYLPESKRINK